MRAQFQAYITYRSILRVNQQMTAGLPAATNLRAGFCTGQAADQCYLDYLFREARPELKKSNSEALNHCMNSCGGETWKIFA